jgi:hypothetical protein
MREIEQEQIGAVVSGKVADGDVLPVAGVVGEPQRVLVTTLMKPFGPPRCWMYGAPAAETVARNAVSRSAMKAARSGVIALGKPAAIRFA